ncbi:Uncharacterised protein [Trueperella bialowiezensis]|uniref:DUF4192 domain-containing protein n=2 Tax=Trueperella bialowiezensis TaxID=312285 RepID=A0A448PCF4_9ACTO|nr:Uncharacterised protein [Trueperella bialowiezensis]
MGFRPHNSVVLLALATEPDGMSGPLIRAHADQGVPHGLIDTVLEFIDVFNVTNLAIAWYGTDMAAMLADTTSMDLLDTAGLAAQSFLDCRYGPNGYVCVGITDYTHWAGLMDVRDVDGQSVEELVARGLVGSFAELNESPGVMELVFQGSAPLDTEPKDEPARLPWSSRQCAVESARDERERTRLRRKCANVWQEVLDLLRQGIEPEQCVPSDEAIGLLNAGLDSVLLRDRVIVCAVNNAVTNVTRIPRAQLAKRLCDANEYSATYLPQIVDLLEYIARYSDDDDPAAFAVAGYLSWWQNDHERAYKNAMHAAQSDSEYSLAKLVLRALFVDLQPPVNYCQQQSEQA